METVKLPERQVPVYTKADVIVVGGGAAGLAAAIAAARQGSRTILIEEGAIPGGTVTQCLMPSFGSLNFALMAGILAEFCGELEARGSLNRVEKRSSPFDPEAFQALAFEMLAGAGVELLLHTRVVDVLKEGNRLAGVVVANKSGMQAVTGKVVVDASGDADVAALAGESFGADEDRQPMTLMFALGGVDVHRFAAFVRDYPAKNEFFTKGEPVVPERIDLSQPLPFEGVWGFFTLVKQAREKGELELPHSNMAVMFPPPGGMAVVNATHITGLDPRIARDLTQAEVTARQQMLSVHRFLKKDVPGFEDSFIVHSASRIGVRESRRLDGAYVLTRDDVMNGHSFPDTIALNGGRISIHGPGEKQTWIKLNQPYHIPYRALLAKANENLLVAGRCLSADHVAHASMRNVPSCFATGEAAGTAAALAVKEGVAPGQLDTGRLRDALRRAGAVVDLPE